MRSANSLRNCLQRAGLGTLAVLVLCSGASAQQALSTAALPATGGRGPYRVLAPGVEITIAPDRHEEETVSTHDIVEILKGIPGLDEKPKLSPSTQSLREMATATEFRRDIWCLEFTFKPVRMIWVDVPQPSGAMERKLIWYMIYHVRNTGGHLSPVRQADGTHVIQHSERDVRFFPTFVLESHEYRKSYLDRVIPVAIAAIEQREDPNRKLLNSVEVGARKIPVSHGLVDRSVWGVVTWEDVDPRVDYFSVAVAGLSNAYQWIDPADGYQAGDPPTTGRQLLAKTLVLNFWRPGDRLAEDRRQVIYGIPGQVDYLWVYR
ncbi:MAG: hypothetical protein AB7O59_10695 [Pirellulales bacterium]